ncbi:MAG: DUF4249 family protein [Bacteroidetes bacterium]|nr:DUF4249 family protein [Bacteroidota bacterium]
MKQFFCLIPAALLFLSCNSTFEPNGTYEERMIIFSVLKSTTDTQYVRVYSTYDPSTNNPLTHSVDTEVTDAVVTVSGGGDVVTFHDTVVVRADTTTLYGKFMHTFVAYKFKPKPNVAYKLTVASPTKGTVTSSIISFPAGTVTTQGNVQSTLTAPNAPTSDSSIRIVVQLAIDVPAYLTRFILRYKEYVNGVWVMREREVPQYIRKGSSFDNFTPFYPEVMLRGQNSTGLFAGQESVNFTKESYIATVRLLKYTIGPSRIEFDGAYFILDQMSQSLFSYYSATNQTADKISIRLDQIDYTNIEGGFGLFAMKTMSESFYIKLPIDIDVD